MGRQARQERPRGMAAFGIIWAGQIASLLGSAMSQFALTLWAYEVTGKATPLAMVGFFFVTPMIVLGPFVGTLVDRGNRRLMMMLSDLANAVNTLALLALYATGTLQIWHLYIAATIGGIFNGFQWPAFSAAITLMLPKEHYARANGMLEMGGNASAIFAPLLAGALIGPVGLVGIMAIDLTTATIAVVTLLFAHIPQPPQSQAGREGAGSFLKETAYGFRYIFARPGLLGLQTVFLVSNLFLSLGGAVQAPFILARSGNDQMVFGSVQSAGAIGGLAGGLVMAAWGGPKRRVHGLLGGMFAISLLGQVALGLGQAPPAWMAASFLGALFGPMANGCSQAIWQSKVAPDVQGRVFATRRLIAWLVMPIAQLAAGPLSDQVLEPAMAQGGSLAPWLGWLVGTGPGAGIGLLFVVAGVLAAAAPVVGYLVPVVRTVEDTPAPHELSLAEA